MLLLLLRRQTGGDGGRRRGVIVRKPREARPKRVLLPQESTFAPSTPRWVEKATDDHDASDARMAVRVLNHTKDRHGQRLHSDGWTDGGGGRVS